MKHLASAACNFMYYVTDLVYDYLERHPMQPPNEFLLPDIG